MMSFEQRIERKTLEQLESCLDHEIKLYQKYLQMLKEEHTSIARFKTDAIDEITQRREELNEQMEKAQLRRLEILKAFPQGDQRKLEELIEHYCSMGKDKLARVMETRRVLSLTRQLKTLVKETKVRTSEYSQLLSFTQKMVDGTLSILWSAKQNISKIYNPQGKISESYHPSYSRQEGVLRQA